MGLKHVKWMPVREGAGEIQRSRCGRFTIILGNDHFTLLDHGATVRREVREDHLKLFADILASGVENTVGEYYDALLEKERV